MSSYRPSYGHQPPSNHNYPPPPPLRDMPPLPPGPPPPYDSHRGDHWRPQQSHSNMYPQTEFTFRNNDGAPHYPREQDYNRYNEPKRYATQESSRLRPRDQHRDHRNLNRYRGGYGSHRGRGNYSNHAAPSDRPLLRQRNETGSEELLGMTEEQAGIRRYMPAEDVSDSDEESMVESDSDLDNAEHNGDGPLEPPIKRRNLGVRKSPDTSGENRPKWSNPDPYTVLPPVEEEARKRKDVVKLIRKSDLHAVAKASQDNQVAANDDFISFGFEEDKASIPDDVPPRPGSVGNKDYRVDVSAVPSGPRQKFSHLENLHGQASRDAPGTYSKAETANSLGPPPTLYATGPVIPEKIIVDTQMSRGNMSSEYSTRGGASTTPPYDDEALGSRKRTYDDEIRGENLQTRKKAGFGQANGSVLPEWLPLPTTDPTPWLRRSDIMTANTGFRLHKEICDFYEFVRPRKFEQVVRQELLSRLQNVVSSHMRNCNVHSFGSFAAGLYLPNADMDVVVLSDSFRSSYEKVICQSKKQLFRFGDFIRSSGIAEQGTVEVITGAKVPIVKFVDRITAIKVDVSFENDTGVIANDTFALWKKQFPAMPLLVTIMKQFLMMRGMNEVQHGGLGGFSVTCLVTSLLQNMPRVQSGEVIPELNLGEMLIEFLDFYGNQLDTARTGITMDPPGYFDKIAHQRPNFRGPVYQASKADRLAIIDPNKSDNDISGGSRNVMHIFHRFARAHLEILTAMKSPSRPSLLDWSLGGNYDSFTRQRGHLRSLYKQRWGTPEQDDVDLLDERNGIDLQWRDNVPSSSGMQNNANTELQNAGDAKLISSVVPEPPRSNHTSTRKPRKKAKLTTVNPNSKTATNASTPSIRAETKEDRKERTRMARANALRKAYPTMQNIPKSITPSQRKRLILHHTQSANGSLQPNLPATGKGSTDAGPAPTKQSRESKKAVNQLKKTNRANLLKQQYPDMKGIPAKLSQGARRKLIAKYKEKSSVPGASVIMPMSSDSTAKTSSRLNKLPTRPHIVTSDISDLKSQKRPTSKMAPLSEERLAEVARNLAAGSNDDPVMID